MPINLKTNLVYCFEANENTGTNLADANGGAVVGTLQSGAIWGAGKLGASSVSLDGSGAYVFGGSNLGIDNIAQLSVGLWFQKSVTGDNYDKLWTHAQNGSNYIQMGLGGPGYGSTSNLIVGMTISGSASDGYNASGGGNISLSNSTWYHALMVFDGSQADNASRLKLYLNGALQTLTFSGTVPVATPDIPAWETWWGRFAHSANNPFAGLLDQMCIWAGRALTAAEALYLVNGGAGRPYSQFIESVQTTPPSLSMSGFSLGIDDSIFFLTESEGDEMGQIVAEAVGDLGCQMGANPSANNASLINAALANPAVPYSIGLRSGYLETTEKILIPSKTGHGLIGQGSSRDINDLNGYIGKPSKIVAKFAAPGGTVIESQGMHTVLRNLHVQGRPVAAGGYGGIEPPSETQDRASIGIHIVPSSRIGNEIQTAKTIIDNVSIYQVADCGLLIGHNLDDLGADTFDGENDNHADTVYCGPLYFYHHYTPGSVHGNTGYSCIVRNRQSLDNVFERVTIHGDPEFGLYIERGGKTLIHQIGGICTGEGETTLLRVGKIDGNHHGIKIGQISIDAGSVGCRCLKMDSLTTPVYSTPSIAIGQAIIPEAVVAVPQFDCQPGNIVIMNAGYLQPGSIKLTGKLAGSVKLVCNVHLINCTLYAGATPANLITGSTGPYCFRWTDCKILHDGASPEIYGRPISDGEILNSVTRITL